MKATQRLFGRQNPWRESATLLLVAPTRVNNRPTVSFLTMTRSKKSKFMPGGQVFPGGAISPIDSSPAWSELYAKAGINLQSMTFLDKNAQRPTIYVEDAEDRALKNLLPQEITLRIAAIRETFEECGILLGKHAEKSEVQVGNPAELQDEGEIVKWQIRVKDNPDEFLTLCRTFSVIPDLKSLGEWSNWLTPSTFPKIRFDTLFFIATVPQPLPVVIDKYEAEDAEWSTADQLLRKHLAGETTLMPPQFYELSRLRDIHTIEDFQTLIELRRKLGIERWFPHVINTNEGLTSVLPGDELYPENPNLYEKQEIVMHDESLGKSDTGDQRSYHRMRFRVEAGEVGVNVTGPPRFGHYYAVPSSKI